MTARTLNQIKTIQSFLTGQDLFIRDIKGVAAIPDHCAHCGAELSVEFVVSQEGLFRENPMATHIVMLHCEGPACGKARCVRWMESEHGELSVADFVAMDRIFNKIMDTWEKR